MKELKNTPPKIAQKLLYRVIRAENKFAALGDLEEEYQEIATEKGIRKANLWYWKQIIRSTMPFLIFNLIWSFAMFRNYFKIALRNIKKYKIYSIINVSGLAIGIAVVMFILLYVQSEISFDQFHKKSDRIFRVMKTWEGTPGKTATMPPPLAPTMKELFPEIEEVTRFAIRDEIHISANGHNFFEDGFTFTDPSTFNIFSVEFLKGDPETALTDPYSILLSESMARKYFGEKNPVDKIISYKGKHDFKVTGVFSDLPETSTLNFNFIVPFTSYEKISSFLKLNMWGAFSFHTYFLIKEKTDHLVLLEKFRPKIKEHLNKSYADKVKFFFQPINDIHLDESRNAVILFSSIAILILIIACINYVNLTTARSNQRIKEIGIRKVVGANHFQLIKQFMGESVIFTIIAFLISGIIVYLFLPVFGDFIGRKLSINLIENTQFSIWIIGLLLSVILFAGSYPAFAVSSQKPNCIFRGQIISKKKSIFRNTLVVFQFTVSILLIIATFVVKGQLDFVNTKDVGYIKNDVVLVDIRNRHIKDNLEIIQNELKSNSDILTTSSSLYAPNLTNLATTFSWPGQTEDQEIAMYLNWVDYDYIDCYGIKIVEGRNFFRNFTTDQNGAFLINETAKKMLGWDTVIGKELTHDMGDRTGKIVGVVKDFHMNSLHDPIEPLCLDLHLAKADDYLSVKTTGLRMLETISFIKNTIFKHAPNYPFVYQYFNDTYQKAYQSEQKLNTIFTLFSMLAMLIACLGLFGLAFFSTEQKTKEIGIRKTLGSSTTKIVWLLLKEFCKWVLIANIIAWPIAFQAMNDWLQNFSYKIDLTILPFLISAIFALTIAVISVGYQSIKAAVANPIEALKYE